MAERPKKILIVGGLTGGTNVAIRLRRLCEEFEITILDRGEQTALATCALPSYIAGTVSSKDELYTHTAKKLWDIYRVKVLTSCDAIRIDRNAKQLIVRDLKKDVKKSLPYDRLILSPGAAPIRPHIEGIHSPLIRSVRNLAEAEEIQRMLRKKSSFDDQVVVMGGSSLGLEMAEMLQKRGERVSLIEAARQVMIGADFEMVTPLHRELRQRGIDLRLNALLSKIIQESDERLRLVFDDGREQSARFVVLATGVRPEVSLALDAGLTLGVTGGIKVNDRMQTGDPDIYAIGDAVEIKVRRGGKNLAYRIPLVGPVRRQAKIAADHLHGFRHHPYQSFGGTSSCRFFDTIFAMTGSGEKQLVRERIPFEKVYVHPWSRIGRDPEAESMTLKILFSPEDGSILGAQAVGGSDVVRKIDVLATVLRFGGTVRQLGDLELSSAPPIGSPRDPISLAGGLATDLLDGLIHHVSRKELKRVREHRVFLDVRESSDLPQSDRRQHGLPGAVSIPLEELRDRLGELDKEKEYVVFSEFGLRGYLACRILLQHGLTAKNIAGGLKTYYDFIDSEAGRSSIDR